MTGEAEPTAYRYIVKIFRRRVRIVTREAIDVGARSL